jgi:hypothetical protein
MKNNKDLLTLYFKGEDGNTLLQCKLTSAPLREEAILRLSMDFFSDPAPCMIHRSAVMSRMYMEILEYFLNSPDGLKSTFLCVQLPERLTSFFDVSNYHEIAVKRV